jgi:CBS domain-containing protein
MWEQDVGVVPVVDTQGRPLGMVTDRDLCIASYTRGQALRDMPVVAGMSPQVYSCRDTDTLGEAERLMKHHQVRRLPVVNESGKLVGILSLNDIVLARTRTMQARLTEQVLGDVTDTIAAICQHRPTAQAHS